MKKTALGLFAILVLTLFSNLFISCGEKDSIEFNVDWQKCIGDIKNDILASQKDEDFPALLYVKDIHIEIDDKNQQIVFSAVLSDNTASSEILSFAQYLVTQFKNVFSILTKASKM